MDSIIISGLYIVSFLGLFSPLVFGLLLQPVSRENFVKKISKVSSYAVFFTGMFALGIAVGHALLDKLSYKIIVSITLFFMLSFKSYYNYYRSKVIWAIAQVTTLEETIWVSLAMSFEWFMVGIAMAPFFKTYYWIFIFLFLGLEGGILLIKQIRLEDQKDRWQHFFRISYLISSTFYIFAGLLLIALQYG